MTQPIKTHKKDEGKVGTEEEGHIDPYKVPVVQTEEGRGLKHL